MIAIIFYFSATGNSQYAAEKIASATGDRIISIGLALKDEHFAFDVSNDERIGLVVPTFAWTLPGVVAEFINKMELTGYKDQYVYGVFTCGESSGKESAALYTMLKEKSIDFNGSFDLVMPDNFILWSQVPSEDRLHQIFKSADEVLDAIISKIVVKENGVLDSEKPDDLYMPLITISSADGSSKFYATSECNGCGLCKEICPMRCIEMDSEQHPVWQGDCTMCLSCLHRCPEQAIQHANDTLDKGRYINPHVKLQLNNEY